MQFNTSPFQFIATEAIAIGPFYTHFPFIFLILDAFSVPRSAGICCKFVFNWNRFLPSPDKESYIIVSATWGKQPLKYNPTTRSHA